MTTNDHDLTRQRQEEIKRTGVLKGFPIWVLRNRHNSILGIFVSKQNAEKRQEELSRYMNIKLDLLFVEDTKKVTYEIELL